MIFYTQYSFYVSVGLPAFATFLKSEFSEENIEFWMACEDYKKMASQENLAAKANDIYDKYVAVNSPREVCITKM